MTLNQLARADSEDLKILTEKVAANKHLAALTVQLMVAVAKIPYVCGKPDCHHPGCVEIRTAQDVVRQLTPA